MNHLRAVICKFNRLFKADFRQSSGVGTNARIGGEYAIHIGPDPDFVCATSGSNDGGGIIGASAAQRSGFPKRVRAAISGDDGHNGAIEKGKKKLFTLLAGGFNIRRSVAKIAVRYNYVFRAHKLSLRSSLLKVRGQHPGGDSFS